MLTNRFLSLVLAVSGTSACAAVQTVYQHSGRLQSSALVPLTGIKAQGLYSFLFSVGSPQAFGVDGRVTVQVRVQGRAIAEKTLHTGDADWYTTFRVGAGAPATLNVEARGVSGKFTSRVNRWPDDARVPGGANHTWQLATAMELGKTVFASGDDVPYIPLPGTLRKQIVGNPKAEDWYKFHFEGRKPQLVFFQVELMDRDDVPVDVSLFRERNGIMEEHAKGQDPVSPPTRCRRCPGTNLQRASWIRRETIMSVSGRTIPSTSCARG